MAINKIEKALEAWHNYVKSDQEQILLDILDDNVVFYSPVVFKPQEGKFLTFLYLRAATSVFSSGKFKYVKEVHQNHIAILEFQAVVDEIEINGVDIISFNEVGRIVEFKVMVRPLKAVSMLHMKMKEILESMS